MNLRSTSYALVVSLALAALLLGLVALRGVTRARGFLEERGLEVAGVSLAGPWTVEVHGLRFEGGNRDFHADSVLLRFAPSAYPTLRSLHLRNLRIGSDSPEPMPPRDEALEGSNVLRGLKELFRRVEALQAYHHPVSRALAQLRPYMVNDIDLQVEGLAVGDGPLTPLQIVLSLPIDPQGALSGVISIPEPGGDMPLWLSPRGRRWTLAAEALTLPNALLPPGTLPLTLGGDPTLDLDLRGEPEGVRGEWRLGLRAFSLLHPLVAAEALGPLTLEVSGSAQLDVLTGQLSIAQIRGNFGELPIEGSVELEGGSQIELSISLAPNARGEDLLGAMPPDSIPALRGLKVEGPLSLSARLSGDLEEVESLRLAVDGDGRGLRLLEGHLGAELGAYPLEGRVYSPVDAQGRSHLRILSRQSPGWTPIHEIHPGLINAVVVAEDGYFFEHGGIDPRAISAAFEANMKGDRGLRGGSTLTQQLAKNLFLSPTRTLMRKVQEVALAWELERRLTKHQILETYLNIIEWGPGVYGISEAAEHYFGGTPKGLSLKQCAFLASIIPGPRVYHAFYLKGALSPRWEARVGEILDQMAMLKHIGWAEAMGAKGETLVFSRPHELESDGGSLWEENPWQQ